MLNKDTLELIIANAVAAAGASLPTGTPAILVPDSLTVTSLEHLQNGRSRFRGNMSTAALNDFSAYVLRRAADVRPVGFIDQKEMQAKVFFNLGTPAQPGHGDDTAVLVLKPTAAYLAAHAIKDKPLSQKHLAEWLEDWSHDLEPVLETGESCSLAQALAFVRNVTIKAASTANHSEHNFGASRSAMDEIEANSQESRIEAIRFMLIPYDGLTPTEILLRVSLMTGEDKPVFKLRWVGEETQKEAIAQDFKEALDLQLGAEVTLTIGKFNPGQ
jgi:uncharacterized protein YfdQ (DUF2303 family)